jgi:photosystem II stability/assembly factor-like uncharacterized protein
MKKIHILTFLLVIGFTSGYSQNWQKINTGYNYIFKGIEFPGGQSQVGFAGGQSVTYMGDGIVIKTTDGGTTWSSLWTGVDQGVEDISFPDQNTGYIGGWSAYFAKTTNGGVTWTPQNPGTDIYYYTAVVFKDANNGVVAAQTNSGAGIYVTTDGGTTWTTGTGLASIPYKVTYVTANTYFLVTNGGHIQKSTDGGLSWTTVTSGLGLLLGIEFYNPSTGIALGEDGWLFKTYDGGVTWTPQQTAYGNPLWHDAAWKSQNEVVLCGTPETIWRSLDGGATWADDYPASTYNPALYEVLYTTDGIAYICGSQGWFYRKAPELTAAFSASNTTICNGTSVQFTDLSVGSPTSWNWTFEGGTPATSTLQNPSVTYATAGVYDVSLTVMLGSISNTVSNTNMIHVDAPVTSAPAQPTGPVEICGSFNYGYTTTSVPSATSYIWAATPASAGSFSGTGTTGTLAASNTWNGPFTITVSGSNACGAGPASAALSVSSTFQPNPYSLFSGGGYCNGQAGYEIKLEDSDLSVDYQLYKDGIATGALVPGTGNTLSFGLQTVGTYTVSGVNGACAANMLGASTVFIIDPPAAATQPTGPASTCNNVPSTFTAALPANGFTLLWTLNPASAGNVTQPTLTTAVVDWNPAYSGTVDVSVQGQNECGNGTASPAHTITVNALPAPSASGNTSVCKNQEITYATAASTGSSYTWAVTGGSIQTGQGSNEIIVMWGNPGTGTVAVTETSAAGCTATSPLLTVAVDACTGITENKADELSVYPNPASDHLNVTLKAEFKTSAEITIYNSTGQLVHKFPKVNANNTNELRLDISDLNPGGYMLRIIANNQTLSKSFVKK